MRCSGCGMVIPMLGAVCPFCGADKTRDRAFTLTAYALALVFGALGCLLFGGWGAFGGMVAGGLLAVALALRSGHRQG